MVLIPLLTYFAGKKGEAKPIRCTDKIQTLPLVCLYPMGTKGDLSQLSELEILQAKFTI